MHFILEILAVEISAVVVEERCKQTGGFRVGEERGADAESDGTGLAVAEFCVLVCFFPFKTTLLGSFHNTAFSADFPTNKYLK